MFINREQLIAGAVLVAQKLGKFAHKNMFIFYTFTNFVLTPEFDLPPCLFKWYHANVPPIFDPYVMSHTRNQTHARRDLKSHFIYSREILFPLPKMSLLMPCNFMLLSWGNLLNILFMSRPLMPMEKEVCMISHKVLKMTIFGHKIISKLDIFRKK